MFEHEEEGNQTVVRVEVFAEVVMTAHLAGKERVLLAHSVLHECMSALRNDRRSTGSAGHLQRRPDYARVKDDLVIVAVFLNQDISEQRREIGPRDEAAVFVK